MPRVKIQLADNIKRVVVFETDATIGATLGANLFLPNGQVGTPTSVLAWLGGALPGGSTGGNNGIPVGNYLTTKGDLLTRDTQVQRLPIGSTGYVLRVASGLPSWAAPAALTRVNDTNVTLTLGGTPATALLAGVDLQLGWAGELSVGRGGTSFGTYTVGDILYASGTGALSKRAIGSTGQVLTVVAGVPAWATLPDTGYPPQLGYAGMF